MGRWTVGGGLIALLVLAAPAAGADRYATPAGGSAEPCTAAVPCSVKSALEGAGAGPNDVIRLAAGEYTLPSTLQVLHAGMTLQGPATGGRARLTRTGSTALAVFAADATLRDFDIGAVDAGGSAAAVAQNPSTPNLRAERLRIAATGTTGIGVVLQGGTPTLRDSLVTSGASSGVAVLTGRTGATLANVTAHATGASGIALLLSGDFMTDPQAQVTTATNSILSGVLYDVRLESSTATKTIRLDIDHSSYDVVAPLPGAGATLNAGAGNQTAPPLLGTDRVTQLAGSPTTDAGAPSGLLGSADLFGGQRASGPAPDIGAHEVQVPAPDPPVVPPAPPSAPPPAPPSAPAVVPRPPAVASAPNLTAVRLDRRRFRAGARGVRVRWTVSQRATIVVSVLRRSGRRERRVGRALRVRGARPGSGSVAFTGRGLRPGRYVLSVVAEAAGRRSAPRRVAFTILTPRRPR